MKEGEAYHRTKKTQGSKKMIVRTAEDIRATRTPPHKRGGTWSSRLLQQIT